MTAQLLRRCRQIGILVAALLVAPLLVGAPTANADHVAGASYSGTIFPSGTVSFNVSADGSQVQSFQANMVPCDAVPGTANASVGNIPTNSSSSPHTFSHSAAGVTIQGAFSPGLAEGQLAIVGCNNFPVSFRADEEQQVGPCHCDDVIVESKHQKQFFSVDDRQQFDKGRTGVVANFFKSTKTVKCKGVSPPGCEAKLEIQISKGDKDIAEIPNSERKVKCKKDDYPAEFKKSFEWRLRVWTGALKKKGIKKINGRFKIECDGTTIFVPWVVGLKPTGRVSKDDTDLGNPAG